MAATKKKNLILISFHIATFIVNVLLIYLYIENVTIQRYNIHRCIKNIRFFVRYIERMTLILFRFLF